MAGTPTLNTNYRTAPIEMTGEATATVTDPLISPSSGFQQPWAPRPITSTLDTWDDRTQMEYGRAVQSVGSRPGWNVPRVALTSESINTIRKSATTTSAAPSIATVSANVKNPTMPVPASNDPRPLKPVANMVQVIKPMSQVEISFSVLISAPANTSPLFVIFRDGQRLSQEYHQFVAPNVRSLVSATYIDPAPSFNKPHVYQLYCRPTSEPITFYQLSRTFQVSDQRAL